MKNKNAILFAVALVSVVAVGACTGENMAPNYERCKHIQCGPVDAGPDAGPDAGCDVEAEPDGGLVNG